MPTPYTKTLEHHGLVAGFVTIWDLPILLIKR